MDSDATQQRIGDLSEHIMAVRSMLEDVQKTTTANTVILERNTLDMEKHIKRTDVLEHVVSDLILPIRLMKFGLVIAGSLSTTSGAVFALVKLLEVAVPFFRKLL